MYYKVSIKKAGGPFVSDCLSSLGFKQRSADAVVAAAAVLFRSIIILMAILRDFSIKASTDALGQLY